MYSTIEQNDLRRRRSAWILAVGFHLCLAAVFYLSASEKPTAPTTEKASVAQARASSPQAKAVNIP